MANNKDFKVKNGIKPTAYHEGVGTVVSANQGYSLSDAVYVYNYAAGLNEGFSNSPTGVIFNNNGTKLYISHSEGNVYEHDLSTAYDTSTASYNSSSLALGQSQTDVYGIAFNNDGTKLYSVDRATDAVYQYSLSTPYDIITGSYDSVSFSLTSQSIGNPRDITFKSDGTSFYIVDNGLDAIFQYNLSTAFDLSTASYSSKSFSVLSEDGAATGIEFFNNGTAFFLTGYANENVYQYSLTTAWDISTASYDSISFSVVSQITSPVGLTLNADGTKLYLAGTGPLNQGLIEYNIFTPTNTLDLSTGSVFDLTPTSDVQVTLSSPADSGTVSQATMLLTGGAANTYDVANATYDSKSFDFSDYEPTFLYDGFFKPDGTKFFIIGTGTDKVQAFNLSTAWDISTVSAASEEFSPAQAGAEPISLSFKSDGTKMYVSSYGGLTVYQYSLSTAWDVSSATYDSKSFSYGTQANAAYHIELSSDGTKLYVNNTGSGSPGFIYQYTLSTAWDISTASYDSVALDLDASPAPSLAANCYTFTFSDDGTKLFNMAENASDAQVITYNLTSAWDISTATYADEDYDIAVGNQNDPTVFRVGDSGKKMYYGGTGDQTIYQFTIVTAATITYDTAVEWPGGTAPTSPSYGETDIMTFTTSDGGTTYQAVQAIDGAS
jgi:6-phosphogluconolactonase (cycloisomerase 2 family)